MKKQIYPAFYDEESRDVTFSDTAYGDGPILLDFIQAGEFFTKMNEQYKQIQRITL